MAVVALCSSLVVVVAPRAEAQQACTNTAVVQWTVDAGGNGHYYQGICGSTTWTQAKAAAEAAGGYLATSTSASENAFLVSNFGSGFAIFAWLGGVQTAQCPFEPAGCWTWVTGEPWSYTNWGSGEPNNSAFGGGPEGVLEIRLRPSAFAAGGYWNDRNDVALPDHGYIIEWDKHDLSVSTAGAGGGTVTSQPDGITCGTDCSESYERGTSVTLTATPDAASTFTGWSGDCSGTSTCVVSMDAAKSVTATFAVAQRALGVTRAGAGGGTVTSQPGGIDCGQDCSETYAHGTSVTLTATPDAASAFVGWSGACGNATGDCVVTMDAAKSVTATFGIAQRALTVARAGGGAGTVTSTPPGIDCGADCSEAYPHGTSVTLSATPAPGSVFIGWTGPCSGQGTCVVSMDGARSVTATFERIPRATRSLTVERTGGGVGTVTSTTPGIDCGTDCSHVYEDATTVTLVAEPSGRSSFGGWSGCSRVSGNRCIAEMNTDLTVTAHFVAPRTLTVQKQGNGSGRVTSDPDGIDCGSDCAAGFADASDVVLTARPAENSKLRSWEGCKETSGLECTVAMGQDKTVTARFVKISIPHSRKVSLTLSGHLLATGLVTVDDDYAPCAEGVLVRIQRKKGDRWITIARPSTKEDGTFRAKLEDRTRTYRARTPATPLDDGPDRCRDAKSPEVEHRHDDKANTLVRRYPA